MSREDGFSIADVDTSMLDDPKFRTLWRRLRGRAAMGQAVTVYLAAVLESWRSGERSTADDAAPTWLGDVSGPVAALSAVGLLDEAGKVPEHAWLSWFVPAFDRREARRAAGSIGGQHKASNARASLQQSPSGALPVRPSVRSDRPAVPSRNDDFLKDDDDHAAQAYARGPITCARCGGVILGGALKTGAGPYHAGGCPTPEKAT